MLSCFRQKLTNISQLYDFCENNLYCGKLTPHSKKIPEKLLKILYHMINEPLNVHDAEVPTTSFLTIKDICLDLENLVFIDETDSGGVSEYGGGN